MIHEAIHELYSNVKQVVIEENGTIKALDIDGNEVSNIDMEAVNSKAIELQTEYDNKIAQEKADKVSGNQKLLDLGLTQAEATALTGYKPE
tara:strand:- start:248 stop:520 length:273 start_codon:yes stop_codon:yes gene_type:complete